MTDVDRLPHTWRLRDQIQIQLRLAGPAHSTHDNYRFFLVLLGVYFLAAHRYDNWGGWDCRFDGFYGSMVLIWGMGQGCGRNYHFFSSQNTSRCHYLLFRQVSVDDPGLGHHAWINLTA